MKIKAIIIFGAIVLLFSCNEKKKALSFYDNSDITEDSLEENSSSTNTTISFNSSEEVAIPFVEQGGVKLVDVTLNQEFTVKMIIDSGCSSTLISVAEAKYLYDKGCITQNDIIGITQAQIADGSIVENMVINLRELVIGGQISCSNVTATVSVNTQAPLLLGNEVLNRVPSYSIDNENKLIKFKLR